VTIYVGSISQYNGNWLLSGRTFVVPGLANTTRSYHASARRYLGDDGNYLGVRYGRGSSREVRTVNDFEVLDADIVGGDALFVVRRRFEVNVNGSYGREDRAGRAGLAQYSVSTGLGLRF
jgi:YaiO family outer membrane protein